MSTQRFVVRQTQLDQLHAFLNQALASHGQIAFVVGEAGSGKTALITEFASQAEASHSDLVVTIGSCNAQTGIGDPYLPFREILAQLTGDFEAKLAQGAITAEDARRLSAIVRWTCDALVEFGPDLINILVPGTALIAKAGKFVIEQAGWTDKFKQLVERKAAGQAGTTLDQSHIFEQYTNVIKALANKTTLVLVLDDLQWADSASTSLLFHLGRRIRESRILVLGAFRPEEVKLGRDAKRHPLDKVLAESKRYYGDITIDLDQAEKDEARQFVDALLDLEPNRLGKAFRQALVRQTGGNPLFAVELLREMREQEDLEKDVDGHWIESARLDWFSLPARVEGVIEERIGRLETELRETLIVGSVEGEVFTAEVIAHVRAVNERGLVHSLSNTLDKQHHLVVSQGIRRLGAQLLSSYRFRHNLFQKYLYDSLDAAEKAYLHQAVGSALETFYKDQTEEIAVQLGRHFDEAGLAEEAIHYLRIAAEQARLRYANTEAIVHLRQALALIKDTPLDTSRQKVITELHENLGDLLILIGEPEEAKIVYSDALTWVPQDDPIWRSRLYRRIGKTWDRQRYYHEEALKAYDLAESILGQEPTEFASSWWQEWIAIQLDRIWTIYWSKGQWREMLELAEKTRSAVQQYGTPAQRSSFNECLVLVDNRRYRYVVPDETLTYAQTAIAASQESHDLGQVGRSQYLLGFCHLWRGELDEARDVIQASLTLAERTGDVDVQLMCLTYLPVVFRKCGQVEETKQLLIRSLVKARENESIEYEGVATANLGWVALREGNLDEAQIKCQAALALWKPPIKMPFRWLALWPLISVNLARNQIAEAIDHARALLDPDQQPLPEALAAVIETATSAWEAGEPEITRTHLNRATQLAQELGYL